MPQYLRRVSAGFAKNYYGIVIGTPLVKSTSETVKVAEKTAEKTEERKQSNKNSNGENLF
jgi:hypothetical protein